jgi:signal transduction histidine kinase
VEPIWLGLDDAAARRLVESALDALTAEIAFLDADGEIVSVNEAWRSFGRENGAPDDFVGRNYLKVCANASRAGDQDAAHVRAGLERLLDGRTPSFRHRYVCAENSFDMRAVAVGGSSGSARVLVAHENITLALKTQRALSEAARRTLSLHEDERRQIATALRDSTAQYLTGLRLKLGALENGAPLAETLSEMREIVGEAQREILTLAYVLRPQRGWAGLRSTLEAYVEGFRRRTGVAARLAITGPVDDLTSEMQEAVGSLVQEVLIGVHRRQGSATFRLMLELGGNGLSLTAQYEGPDTAQAVLPDASLQVLEAHVHRLRGDLTTKPSAAGPRLRIEIPVAPH